MTNKAKDMSLITIDECDEEILDGYKNLPGSVKKLISQMIIDDLNEIVGLAESCQSPIEQLLGIALDKEIKKRLPRYTKDFFITPQETIQVDSKKYRVDFFLVVERNNGESIGFIIECDGHDYHEKTKEQARKDKKRDRDLLSIGHQVIRFTGSEIVDNPISCAREVIKLVLNNLKK